MRTVGVGGRDEKKKKRVSNLLLHCLSYLISETGGEEIENVGVWGRPIASMLAVI